MLRTHRTTAFAVVALALLAVRSLPAQFTLPRGAPPARPNPSHLQLRGIPATADSAEDLLSSRLSSLPSLLQNEALRKALEGLRADSTLRKQIEDLAGESGGKIDPSDQRFLQSLQDFAKRFNAENQHSFGPEFQKQMMKSFQKEAQRGDLTRGLKPEARGPRPRPDRTGERMHDITKPLPPTGGPAARPREGRNNQQMAQYANQAASWLNRMGVNTEFTRSASWQKLVHGLNGVASGEGGGAESGDSWLKRFGLDLSPSRWLSSESWNFRMQFPRASLPDLSRFVPSFPQGSGTSGAPAAPSGGVWRGLLWLVLGLVLCVAAWLLLSRRKGTAAELDDSPTRKLGPWPIRPEDVRSREDLVQAFEYLSLLRLGFSAQNWNHHQIADALALDRGESELARAAQSLAGTYEQARYAPPQQTLSAADLSAARHDLCLLAGVAAA